MKDLNSSIKKSGTKRKAASSGGDGAHAGGDFFAKRRITQSDVDRVTDRLVIGAALPHRIVDSLYFREAVLLGCPSSVRVGCRKTFKGRLSKHSAKMETNIRKKFEEVAMLPPRRTDGRNTGGGS